ncbi:MAG: VOC family protein [Cytophagales bacterium]
MQEAGNYKQNKRNLSYVLYKVSNLEGSVIEFQNRGFKVDFGSKNKSHNALIYFSEGPYIELLNKVPVPFCIHLI